MSEEPELRRLSYLASLALPPQTLRTAACATIVVSSLIVLPGDFALAHHPASNPTGHKEEPVTLVPEADQPSITSSIPALRDFKKALLDRGVNFQLSYIQDTFGNPIGGVKQGANYGSVLYMAVDADLAKVAGLDGASFRVNAYQIQGRSLSNNNIFNYSTISGFAARPTTRLFELWVEQKFFNDLASFRIGQLTADNQFFISEFSNSLFVNVTFGWPNLFIQDLPGGGGPNYPLATPGVRLKMTPFDQITLLAAIFNGDPAGSGFTGLEEIKDPSGTNFRLRDPAFIISEAQFRYNEKADSEGLAGAIKIGGWRHLGRFNDDRFGTDGRSLADPSSNGQPLVHRGNFGLYGVINQMLWRAPGESPKKGIGGFARFAASPSDRNLMNLYAEAGVSFMGIWKQRPDDTFGFAAAYSQLSPSISVLDREAAFYAGEALPIRVYELALEVTYQAQIDPSWIIQPDFQYIFRPGGGVINPINPALGRIPDAAVFGLRTSISF
ncbi:carbohydrate porin [Methylocystis sp. H62]|uniref:carbohydrate porin n=1 Tax=Methylocystis sp. H62 TaxID=2785789 RepID=UPI0018C32182|nr:carbohydrate porin [Methylocystis sp. H62]MBG0792119.1 carbohydrate porin [Methylocystis sp. H62]